MQKQQLTEIINITPETMDDLLRKVTHTLRNSCNKDTIDKIVKSLFYGLWNFDKMINQHILSTKIALLLHQIPLKTAKKLLEHMFSYLNQKWNFIDHYRINKFMLLVQYLLRESFKLPAFFPKLQLLIFNTVFNNSSICGLAYHVSQIYYRTYKEAFPSGSIEDLNLLKMSLQTIDDLLFRKQFLQKAFQFYKEELSLITDGALRQSRVEAFRKEYLPLALAETQDQKRKDIYSIIMYVESHFQVFALFLQHQFQQQSVQQHKTKPKLSANKLKAIQKQKLLNKNKSKLKNKGKLHSKGRFEDRLTSKNLRNPNLE